MNTSSTYPTVCVSYSKKPHMESRTDNVKVTASPAAHSLLFELFDLRSTVYNISF